MSERTNSVESLYLGEVEAERITRYARGSVVWIGHVSDQQLRSLRHRGLSVECCRYPSDLTGDEIRCDTLILSAAFANLIGAQALQLLCELTLSPGGRVICLDLESYDAFLGRFNGASFTPEACGPSHFIHGNASDKPASVDALSKIKEALQDQALRSGLAKLEVLMSPSLPPTLGERSFAVLSAKPNRKDCPSDNGVMSVPDGAVIRCWDWFGEVGLAEAATAGEALLNISGGVPLFEWVREWVHSRWGIEVVLQGSEVKHGYSSSQVVTDAPPVKRLLMNPDLYEDRWAEQVAVFLENFKGVQEASLEIFFESHSHVGLELATELVERLCASRSEIKELPVVRILPPPSDEDELFRVVSRCDGLVRIGEQRSEGIERLARKLGLTVVDGVPTPTVPTHLAKPCSSGQNEQGRDVATPGSLSVVIVTFNSASSIATCLHFLMKALRANDEVIVVDNASSDDTVALIEGSEAFKRGRLRLTVNERNEGYSRGINSAVAQSSGEMVLTLNPDTAVLPETFDDLIAVLESDPAIGAVGPLSNAAGNEQRIDRQIDIKLVEDTSLEEVAAILRNLDKAAEETKLLIGFCLLMRRGLFDAIGGCPPELFAGSDDVVMSHRIRRAGYRLVIARKVFIRHVHQVSFESLSAARAFLIGEQGKQVAVELLSADCGHDHEPLDSERDFGVSWALPAPAKISVVMLASSEWSCMLARLQQLHRTCNRRLELVVVGVSDAHRLREWAARTPYHVVLVDEPSLTTYSGRVNVGLEAASGDYIALVDERVILTEHWLAHLLASFSLSSDIGIAAPKLSGGSAAQAISDPRALKPETFDDLSEECKILGAGVFTPSVCLSSSCMVISRTCLNALGGFHVGYWGEDICGRDFGYRAIHAGFKQVVVDSVALFERQDPWEDALGDAVRRYDTRLFSFLYGGYESEPESIVGLANAIRLQKQTLRYPRRVQERIGERSQPLPIAGPATNRLLLIPDFDDMMWESEFTEWWTRVAEMSGWSLLVRIECADSASVARIYDRVNELVAELSQNSGCSPLVILETSKLEPSERGCLYAAAHGFAPSAGRFAEAYMEEAKYSGIRIFSSGFHDHVLERVPAK